MEIDQNLKTVLFYGTIILRPKKNNIVKEYRLNEKLRILH